MKRILINILTFPIRHEVETAIKHIQRNIDVASICCGTPKEYIGEHSGLRSATQFYQCINCKRIDIQHKHDWEKK